MDFGKTLNGFNLRYPDSWYSIYLGCISFACPKHSERVLPNEIHQHCVRGQPEQCSAYTTFIGSVTRTRVNCDLDIEHDQYIMLLDAQVYLVQ
jgi:hypothetical protein